MLLAALFFVSCTQTDLVQESGNDVNLAVTISTRSSTDGNAIGNETGLSEVFVLIYNSNFLLENGSELSVSGDALNAKRWVVKEGTKHVYVIANPDAELKSRLNARPSHSDLLAMISSTSSFDTAVGNISSSGMLMTGKAENQFVNESANSVSVDITRRMARVDFYMRKEANVTGTVTVKSVKLEKTRKAGKLYDDANSYTDANVFLVDGALTNSSGVVVSAITSSPTTDIDYTLISHNYTFSNVLGTTFSESDVNKLNITLTYTEGSYTMTYSYVVYISSSSGYANSISIIPNKVYQVKATLYKEGLSLIFNGVSTITNTFIID